MIWCRFEVGQNVSFGIVEGDQVTQVSGSPFDEHTVTSTKHPLNQVKLLAPVIPPMLYAAPAKLGGFISETAASSRWLPFLIPSVSPTRANTRPCGIGQFPCRSAIRGIS